MLKLLSETGYPVRMISNLMLFLSLFVAVSCKSSNLEIRSNAQVINTNQVNIQVTNTPQVKEDKLEQAAKKLVELYDNKNCSEFINAFPNTFEDLNQLYGYEDGKGGRILFSKFPEHFSYFFDCSEVSDREKLNKVINIGIGGKWEADTIETFQDSTFNLVKNHLIQTKEILENSPDEKAASFWYFLLDGPSPNDKEKIKKVDLLSNLLGKKSKQSKILLEQYQKVRVDWKDY